MQNSKFFPGTIPQTPVSGVRKVCFCSPEIKTVLLHIIAMQNSKFFPGTKPRTFILGKRKVLFSFFSKMYQNSPTAMPNSKTFPGDPTPDPRFRGEESLFLLSENVLKLSYSNAEFKTFPGEITPDPRFRGEESLFLLSENVPKLSYRNSKFENSPGDNTPDLRFSGGKFCFRSSKMYLLKLSYSIAEFKISRGQYITLYYITLHYRYFTRHLHLE